MNISISLEFIYFSTLEDKIRISARPCNILYILLHGVSDRLLDLDNFPAILILCMDFILSFARNKNIFLGKYVNYKMKHDTSCLFLFILLTFPLSECRSTKPAFANYIGHCGPSRPDHTH